MAEDEEFEVYIPENSQTSADIRQTTADKTKSKEKYYKSSKESPKKLANKADSEEEAIELVRKFKEPAEANVVLCLYQNADLFLDCKLTEKDFTYNSWRVYYVIARDLYEARKSLTEDNINFYLDQHPQLHEKYVYYGGYNTIEKVKKAIKVEDFEGYINEICKWNAILKIAKVGFPIKDKLSDYADMKAEEIYDELTLLLNDAFMTVDDKVQSYNAFANLHELNAKLDAGKEHGLELGDYENNKFNLLNSIINGFNINGNIYGLGACTGVGKSWLSVQYLFPLALTHKQRVVFIINEEDHEKIQRELETWVINNIFLTEWLDKNKSANSTEKYFNKKKFLNGHFSESDKELLNKAADFLEEMKESRLITVIPLERYTCKAVIRIIKKYNKMGVRIFCLDTLKESFDSRDADTWKSIERDLVDLYNTVKPAALNVGLFVTYQLGKQAVKLRYLTNTEVGQAKNIMDVISVNLMVRKPFLDEYVNQRRALKITKSLDAGTVVDGQTLQEQQNYLITFITKNRQGENDPYQIVHWIDQGTNRMKEFGRTFVMQDF